MSFGDPVGFGLPSAARHARHDIEFHTDKKSDARASDQMTTHRSGIAGAGRHFNSTHSTMTEIDSMATAANGDANTKKRKLDTTETQGGEVSPIGCKANGLLTV